MALLFWERSWVAKPGTKPRLQMLTTDASSEEKGPAGASNEDADPAHDPRVWIVPGHRRADVVHRQVHSGPRGLLASQGTERGRAGNSLPVLRA